MAERTFAIIKPDATANGVAGLIIYLTELNKFKILKIEKTQLTQEKAKEFYGVHSDKPFFKELVDNIVSGPLVIMALEKENAVADWRTFMGATDPLKSAPGTIRNMFGKSISWNAVHGSDSPENAKIELNLFFPNL